ncbi:hypothetical protein DPSP01_013388 [Paraphaeosphaeria sporulosa]
MFQPLIRLVISFIGSIVTKCRGPLKGFLAFAAGLVTAGAKHVVEQRIVEIEEPSENVNETTLAFKLVDQVWKGSSTEDDERYALIVRRIFDFDKRFTGKFFQVNSPYIRSIVCQVMGNVSSVSLIDVAPEHLDLLLERLREDYRETELKLPEVKQLGMVPFDLVWLIFKPGTIAVTHADGSCHDERCFIVDAALLEIEHRHSKAVEKVSALSFMGCGISSSDESPMSMFCIMGAFAEKPWLWPSRLSGESLRNQTFGCEFMHLRLL